MFRAWNQSGPPAQQFDFADQGASILRPRWILSVLVILQAPLLWPGAALALEGESDRPSSTSAPQLFRPNFAAEPIVTPPVDADPEEITDAPAPDAPAPSLSDEQGAPALEFAALRMDCQQNYFTKSLDLCTADIRVTRLPEPGGSDLVDKEMDVTCAVDFLYGGAQVNTFKAKIRFHAGAEKITRIKLDGLSCVEN